MWDPFEGQRSGEKENKSRNFHVWKWKWKPPYAIPLLAGGEEGGSEVQGQELAARQLEPDLINIFLIFA